MQSSIAERQRGVRTLAFGMLAAQVAAFMATPLLTRLYDPAAFGVYALLLSMIAVGAPVAALRLDAAIALPADRGEAWKLMLLGLRSALAVAVVLSALIWLARPSLLRYELIDGAAADLLPWLPVFVLAAGLFQLGSAWNVRERTHAVAARGRATQGIVTASMQGVFGFVFSTSICLLTGDLIGRVAALLVLVRGISPAASAPSTASSRDLLRRYGGFATYSSAAALVNALNGALPILIVGPVLGLHATGLLLLAQRVASLPATLLTTAVSQVFAVELARAVDAKARVALYRSTLRHAMFLSVPGFTLVAVLSAFYGEVFGEEWRDAGAIAASLLPFYMGQLLSGATIVAVDVMQAHRARLVREVIYLIGMLIVLFLVARASGSLALLALAISSFGVLFYVFSVRWVDVLLKRAS